MARAQLCMAPRSILRNVWPPATAVVPDVVAPPPSCPLSPYPQQYARPSGSSPQVCEPPATTTVKRSVRWTRVGVVRFCPPLSPSRPCPPYPQQYASSAAVVAHVCPPPAEICRKRRSVS